MAVPPETLSGLSPEALTTMIRTDNALKEETARLRRIKDLDANSYKKLKTRLPYIVGSDFENGIRKSDFFKACHYVLLDVDHCMLENQTVPGYLAEDSRVLLAFVSPGGEGFKVLFRLESPCLSLLEYKIFYREFAIQFAEKNQLAGSVDLRTCDATRACFLAHDTNVYFNPEATGICWDAYIEKEEMFQEVATSIVTPIAKPKAALDEQKYQAVLKEINPKQTVRKADKQIFVPEEILALQTDFERICKENNWELIELKLINYGQKVMVRQGYKYAEVNVFFGKKGFSIVKSPKTGADPYLSEALLVALEAFLFVPIQTSQGITLNSVLMQN